MLGIVLLKRYIFYQSIFYQVHDNKNYEAQYIHVYFINSKSWQNVVDVFYYGISPLMFEAFNSLMLKAY